MAHNLKGYDGIFVMNYLLNHLKPGTQPPSVLNQGNKILTLQYNDVKRLMIRFGIRFGGGGRFLSIYANGFSGVFEHVWVCRQQRALSSLIQHKTEPRLCRMFTAD